MTTKRMHLDGIHHITAITADGQRCLDFYAGILGLAFLGRERDFEAPDSHLIRLGHDLARPGGVLNFVEAPRIRPGRAGGGMAYRVVWSVAFPAAIGYWADRISEAGIEVRPVEAENGGPALRFADPDGLEHEFALDPFRQGGLTMGSAAIPPEHALLGISGVRAYGRESVPSADILAGRLGFSVVGRDSYRVAGEWRSASFAFDPPPAERGSIGAGTIHHVAWACDGSLPAWRQRVIGMGCRATPVIDRSRCLSIYFREPSGVLFEIATRGPGAADEVGELARRGFELSSRVDPRVRLPA